MVENPDPGLLQVVAMTRNYLRRNYQNCLLLMAAETAETGETAAVLAPAVEGILGSLQSTSKRQNGGKSSKKSRKMVMAKAAKVKGSLLVVVGWLIL